MILQLFNTSLRLAALGLKLMLTLYMGKYLGLSEMGTYGLVAASVAISIPLLGFRLDYIVLREIVDKEEREYVPILRDEFVFYLINYIIVAVLVLLFISTYGIEADKKIIFYAMGLAMLESFATITSTCIGSLKRPILSNFLFFVRSASWTIPAMVLGFFYPEYRSAEVVFGFWLIGVLVSLVFTAFVWRKLPWREAFQNPVNWPWIYKSVKIAVPIWISGVCAALASNLDRFVIEKYLTRDMVGIASFYASFIGSIGALLASGVFAFKYPFLIAAYKNKEKEEFRNLAKMMCVQSSLSGAVLSILIGAAIPWMGSHFGRPEFALYASTLWLMLFGSWLKSTSEGLYYVQYSRHQDRDIWLGNIMILVPALGLNLLLVPRIGLIGIGYSAIGSALLLGAWRVYSVMSFKEKAPA